MPWRARCVETRTAGSESGLGKRTDGNTGTAPQADSTTGRDLRLRNVEPLARLTVVATVHS
jgi:hypothetical protein